MQNWVCLDLETSGVLPEYALQPWRLRQRKAWMTTVAISWRSKAGELRSDGMVLPNKAYLRAVLERAIEQGRNIVTWNGTFDMAWLFAAGLGELVEKVRWLDAMLLWQHLDMSPLHQPRSLKGPGGGIDTFCPERQGYQADVNYHDMSPENLAKLLAYNMGDTEATLIVAEKVWEKLGEKPTIRQVLDLAGNPYDLDIRRAAAVTEARCMAMVAKANVEGMRVDHDAVAKLHTKLSETVVEMAGALAPHGVTEKVIRSPKQLSALLFDVWGLPQIKERSTDKDVLSELTVVDERVALLMQFREALGLRTKFVENLRESCTYNEDGLTRPQAKIYGTYTSRLTYGSNQRARENGVRPGTTRQTTLQTGFALHQMKRGKDFRSLVLAPEGHDIVEFDAAGQEFRWMAILSGDETMLALCEPGGDAHSFMASAIYGRNYDDMRAAIKAEDPTAKKQRQGGKVANLALQYRTGPKTFRIRARTDHNLRITEQEAASIHSTYLRTYPGVPKYWDRQIQQGRRVKYAETLAGRRVHVTGNWTGEHQWAMESTMINFPVQGTGGDQKYLALSMLKSRIAQYDARFAWDLHDGIYLYVPKAKAMKFAVETREALGRLPYDKAWAFAPPIPLPWDCKIGPSWGALKPVED